MLRQLSPIGLVAAAILTAAPTAPGATPLAECKLDFARAKAALKAMRQIGTQDKSGDEVTWIVTSFDPSALRPLGFKATAFEHELWEDEDGQSETLITTLDAGLAPVQAAMLANRKMAQCLQPFARPIPNQCMIAPGNGATGTPSVWIKEQYGKARIECHYTRPG